MMAEADHRLLATLAYPEYKPGQMCEDVMAAHRHEPVICMKHNKSYPHEIPPPPVDTYEAMGRIIAALFKRGLYLSPSRRHFPVWTGVCLMQMDNDYPEEPVLIVQKSITNSTDFIAAVCEAALQVRRKEQV